MKRATIAVLIIAALLFNIIACTPQGTGNGGINTGTNNAGTYNTAQFDPNAKLEGQNFKSEAELLAFIRSNSGNSGSGAYYRNDVMMDTAMVKSESAAAPSAAPTAATGGSAPDHSTTNNQVASVDEADIIKTDGNYIYTVTGSTIFIIKAYPGEDSKVVSTITLKSAPQGLFIDGDKLAVLGSFYDQEYFKTLDFLPRQGMSFLTLYDVSDKTNPNVEKEYKFEGNYQDARMTGGKIYMVVQSQLIYRDHPTPYVIDGSTVSNVAVSSIRYFPIPYDSTQFTTVHSIDVANPDNLDSQTVTTTWTNTIYMSDKNIYITSTENINEWQIRQDITEQLLADKLSASDKALIDKIKNTDDEVLSQAEKKNKIWQVYSDYQSYRMDSTEQQDLQAEVDSATKTKMQTYDALTYTVINRINIDGKMTLAANGRVPGTLNNQFSMDEYNSVLRVATTLSQNNWWIEPLKAEPDTANAENAKIAIMPRPQWNWQSTNNVYTLDMDLKILDKLEGIAKGETIQSARFMNDRLYLVTFRQVDPFFVIDLSDPSNIKTLGQLKVPGFSRYLHPYDKNTIIGIGQDASATGRQTGLKVSLFDVSDVANPKEIAKFVAAGDYSQSTAEWEHKAFLFSREKELLVIPAYSYNYNGISGSSTSYNGAMVFHITPSDITLRGIIDHSSGTQNYGAMVERSLWIDDLLYTKSPNLLRINKISDLSSVNKIELKEGSAAGYKIY